MRSVFLAVVLMGCSFAMPRAIGAPMQVNESEFTALAAGMTSVSEDFERFPDGSAASPLQLRNGVYTGTPSFGSPPWCYLSRCLTVGFTSGTFSGFPGGSVLWSTRLISAVGGPRTYNVDVVGRSGSQRFTLTITSPVGTGAFVGFHDPLGLLQVTFSLPTAPFGTNYSLDNVVVAVANEGPANVPTLSLEAALLLVLLLLALGGTTIRRF